jgi:hypothetical protein
MIFSKKNLSPKITNTEYSLNKQKPKIMKTMRKFWHYGFIAILSAALLTSCNDDDDDDDVPPPPAENEVEVITDLKLIFTNVADSTDVVEANAEDPDGEGVLELVVLDGIALDTSKTYTLTFEIFNNLETPGEDIGEEIAEEDDEHQIFFSFTDGAFADPMGDGNFDDPADDINYNDEDSDAQDGTGNPVGLNTTWTTSSNTLSGGSFRVRLQHQPGIKNSTTGVNDGDTDFDVEFVMDIN